MARMKKATAKKAAPKKVSKRPAPKKQAPREELAPVPTQQNPQPPMGTSPMGANGPMMRKGGKIKKAQGGSSFAKLAPPYDKATYADKIAGATKNKAKSGTSIKKAQFGGLLGGVGKKLLGGAMGKIGGMAGGKIGNMFGGGDSNSMKSGGSIKKAQGGAEPSAGRIQSLQQKTADNVKKINMSNAASSMKKIVPGTVKNGGSVKKCKYGCK